LNFDFLALGCLWVKMEFLQHYDETSQKEVRYKKKYYDKARTLETIKKLETQ